jgi:signal transduction histidine kinase
MSPWFDRLPVHRKLVVLALVASTVAVFVALTGLTLFDVYRYRARAVDDATTLAAVIAENTAAAVAFGDHPAAEQTLATVRVREAVTKACIYLTGGELFAAYARADQFRCSPTSPEPDGYLTAGREVPIVYNDRAWGTVYVERDFAGLPMRVAVTALVGVIMLVVAAAVAFALTQRLTRTISRPLADLAAAVRRMGGEPPFDLPDIRTSEDEVGDLVRAFRAMVARVRDANEGLMREIEERHRVEAERESLLVREREANRLKDEFLAAVSHELRTPLNAILGWAQLLETASLDDEKAAKAIASITRNAQTQARVIEDLVDVSRIVTGKLQLRIEPVDLRQSVDAALDSLRAHAESQRIEFELRAPDTPCYVNGDPDRLRQIVWNLTSNAVKFTPAGGRVVVSTRRTGADYEIEVRDTGIGIEPDMLPHMFDRFRQADGSTTREHGGLGLGLAIVKELVEMHNGSVTIASPGRHRGTTVAVRLPALRESIVPRLADEPVEASLAGVHILAVDDNSDALEVMAVTLTAAGATVRTASTGELALRQWDLERPDVLLCDLAMPEMDGFTVLREIRRRDARSTRRTPAVAVSAHATLEYLRRSRDAGFAAHVAKPFRTVDLLRAVSGALAS